MSLKQENGIRFDPNEYEMIVLIKKMSPGNEGYNWEQNVSVFVNGKETDFLSLSVELNGKKPAPVIKFNEVYIDEDREL
jgi:hypothetical protein